MGAQNAAAMAIADIWGDFEAVAQGQKLSLEVIDGKASVVKRAVYRRGVRNIVEGSIACAASFLSFWKFVHLLLGE